MVNENAGNQRNMNRTLKAILLSAGLCSPSLCFSAIVYDNLNSPDLGRQYFPTNGPTLEFGEQITLAGTDRILSQLTFYTFLTAPAVTTQSATFRFYADSGTNAPVTPFYTTEAVPLTATGFHSYTIGLTTVPPVLDTFIWTVQFSNLGAGESGGLLLYGPPAVGSSFDDFWQKDGTGAWNLMRINGGGTLANFAVQFSAVPEPGVLALGGLGALLLAGLRRFRKSPR